MEESLDPVAWSCSCLTQHSKWGLEFRGDWDILVSIEVLILFYYQASEEVRRAQLQLSAVPPLCWPLWVFTGVKRYF